MMISKIKIMSPTESRASSRCPCYKQLEQSVSSSEAIYEQLKNAVTKNPDRHVFARFL
jgi:hypothetical protein